MNYNKQPQQRRPLPWEIADPALPMAGDVPAGPPIEPPGPPQGPPGAPKQGVELPPSELFGGQVRL